MLILRYVLVFLCCSVHCSFAQQTAFYTKNSNKQTQFNYQWKEQDKTYNLAFSIPNTTLYAMPASPANFNQQLLIDSVYRSVMMHAKTIDPTVARVRVRKARDGLSFNVRSSHSTDEILAQLSAANEEAKQVYLDEKLLVAHQVINNSTSLRHDYSKYVSLSSESIKAVANAIVEIQQNKSPREFIEIALSWIQTIPYNTIESRLNSNGSGFVSPRDLLIQNKGDCDSKSTLLAALLKAYNPKLDVQMVYLSDHALLGLAIKPKSTDITVKRQGIEYVLIEPTGPAQYPIGKVSDSTNMSLRNRQFSMIQL